MGRAGGGREEGHSAGEKKEPSWGGFPQTVTVTVAVAGEAEHCFCQGAVGLEMGDNSDLPIIIPNSPCPSPRQTSPNSHYWCYSHGETQAVPLYDKPTGMTLFWAFLHSWFLTILFSGSAGWVCGGRRLPQDINLPKWKRQMEAHFKQALGLPKAFLWCGGSLM